MTSFFNIVQNLGINSNLENVSTVLGPSDTQSTQNIEYFQKIWKPSKYSYNLTGNKHKKTLFSVSVNKSKTIKEIQKLDTGKACQESDSTAQIIKENIDIVSNFVFNNFNNLLFSSSFPSKLKNANATPILKKWQN